MTIMHHPSDAVLADFANATLDEAAMLVVASHIAQCEECQKTVRQFEAIGGALLNDHPALGQMDRKACELLTSAEQSDPEPAALEGEPIAQRSPQSGNKSKVDHLIELYDAGNWRWLGPGVHWRSVSVPTDEGIRVFMLKARAGTALPHHTHSGIEWTCVLEGAFEHEHGHFGPGDFDEADTSIDHQPVVTKDADCICLVAMNGRLELQGFVGRLLQPFVRL